MRLKATEMWFYKQILRIPWTDKNKEILKIWELEGDLYFIETVEIPGTY